MENRPRTTKIVCHEFLGKLFRDKIVNWRAGWGTSMQELRAFVGHSFSDQDKALVGIFCEHFDNLAKAHLGFSWDHAVEAEPSSLSDKVLAKIEGKNVFIGICTKNELAIRDRTLRSSFFRKDMRTARAQDFQWKTSDWIIQEIGLAVGRKMSVILFLEEGVRDPGGLYGNIEYIRFLRASPQASFDKLLQMLLSLTPKETAGSTADAERPPTEQKNLAAEASFDLEPKPDWTNDRYSGAVVRAIANDDMAALERISDAFRASKYSEGFGIVEWEGRIEWLKILFSKRSDFEKLKGLADSNPDSSLLRMYVARGYDEFGEHEKAAKAFQAAASAAQDEAARISYDCDAATQYAHAGELKRALTVFEAVKRTAKDKPKFKQTITDELRTLAQIEKEDELELAALEQSAVLQPANWQLRFQLAYKHSQRENTDMAFHHYTKIPPPLRDATAWNNLGVSFSIFDMPVKSTSAFRRAEDQGETLAMSNLGFRLLRAGFIEEATERTKSALKLEKYHANITDLLKRLKEVPEEEAKKEAEVLEKVKPKALFYRQFGNAALAETPTEIGEKWDLPEAPEAVLSASLDGTNVRLWTSYEQESNPLVGFLTRPIRQKVVRRIEYTLKLRGNLLIGEVKRTTDGETSASLLALGMGNSKVVMYFHADRAVLYVMEGSAFYLLKRLDGHSNRAQSEIGA